MVVVLRTLVPGFLKKYFYIVSHFLQARPFLLCFWRAFSIKVPYIYSTKYNLIESFKYNSIFLFFTKKFRGDGKKILTFGFVQYFVRVVLLTND